MICLDTSVVVPLFASWHEGHHDVLHVLAEEPRLPARVAVEAYAVLTRLPAPHRVPAGIVVDFLDRTFPPATRLVLAAGALQDAPARCGAAGIDGGATYDALIALTAIEHELVLVSRDRRAASTYRALGAPVRLVV